MESLAGDTRPPTAKGGGPRPKGCHEGKVRADPLFRVLAVPLGVLSPRGIVTEFARNLPPRGWIVGNG